MKTSAEDWVLLKRALVPGILAALSGPAMLWTGTWTVSRPGVPVKFDALLWTLPIFAWLLFVPMAILFAILFAVLRRRGAMATGALIAIGGLAGLPLTFVLRPWMMRLRVAGYASLAERVQPAVSALHAFETANGRPPGRLDELVPRHLDRVPDLGKVEYIRSDDDRGMLTFGNQWMLHVNAAFGMGFDSFVYLPSHQYPDAMLGGVPERVGDWAYIHE